MQFERLEITRLTERGDVYRRVSCLAGRVSVFRARAKEELQLYGDVLFGKTTSERFTVLLDGLPFACDKHLLIGFGEAFFASDERTVEAYLLASGMPSSSIELVLLKHGLGGLAQAPCRELSVEQQKILRIIAALLVKDKVLILNEPFAGVPEQWREELATQIAEHAFRDRVIIVVVKLEIRPDSWIDNEHISRIQLERPRERTIGFGGGELSTQELIQTFRQHLQNTATTSTGAKLSELESPAAPPETSSPSVEISASRKVPRRETMESRIADPELRKESTENPPARQVRAPGKLTQVPQMAPSLLRIRSRDALTAFVGLMVAVLVILFQGGRSSQTPPLPSPPAGQTQGVKPNPPPREPEIVNGSIDPKVEPSELPARRSGARALLDAYPEVVRTAVNQAFRDPQGSMKTLPGFSRTTQPTARNVEQPTPLVQEQTLPPETREFEVPSAPISEPNTLMNSSAPNEEELEAQRELLRRSFMEAVARARERQMQEQAGNENGADY